MERGVKYIWKLIETIPVRHCSPAANMGSLRKRGAAARFSPNPSLFNIHPIFPRYSLSESITRSVAIHGKFRWFSSGGGMGRRELSYTVSPRLTVHDFHAPG